MESTWRIGAQRRQTERRNMWGKVMLAYSVTKRSICRLSGQRMQAGLAPVRRTPTWWLSWFLIGKTSIEGLVSRALTTGWEFGHHSRRWW